MGRTVNAPVLDLLSAYFSEELVDERPGLRTSLDNSPAAERERIRRELADLIAGREMSTEDFWQATWQRFATEDEMYRELADAYRYLFGDAA